MVNESRLESLDRDFASSFKLAALQLQRRVAEFAADWAVAKTGLVHQSLLAGSLEEIASLVSALDDCYFELSEERDNGRASAEEVEVAFGLARAANAVEFVRRGKYAEAIYEGAAAVEDWPELRNRLLEQLG